MKRILLALLTGIMLIFQTVRADEGMWLPLLMTSQHYDALRARGFRMTPEDLYSVNQASLKDAIVLFGRGCTAGLVSAEGLLLTNHHCGYSRIQAHSSVTSDYLTDGFWAMNRDEELPNPGLTASILVRMEDVTTEIGKSLHAGMTEKERSDAIRKASAALVAKTIEGTTYDAEVKPVYHGNQFILVVMEVFRDVRLVGTPPSSIGKFGGDTDNWMWPRHTGDFSIFRIYAGKDNQPAVYSRENIPYKPRKFLEISLQGVKEGDFTMVYGFPAQTEQYLPSFAIDMLQNQVYPVTVDVRTRELDIINRAMASSAELRIKYAARQAGVANGWKKFMGVIPGLENYNVLEKKRTEEQNNLTIFAENPLQQQAYRDILNGYSDAYSQLRPLERWNTHFNECFWKQPFFRFIFRAYWLPALDYNTSEGTEQGNKTIEEIRKAIPGFYKSIDQGTEQQLMAAMIGIFTAAFSDDQLPPALLKAKKKYGDDFEPYVQDLFAKSLFASETAATAFFGDWKTSSVKRLKKDPLFSLMKEIVDHYRNDYHPGILAINQGIDSLHRLNIQMLLEARKGALVYPDANGTLRLSWGNVQGSFPRDGVMYHYQTTLGGIFMKEDPAIEDYAVPSRLREINDPSLYAPYSTQNTMPVAFIASNHTTGGNSGSPVLDAGGRLIGLNFDRAWEGTMSDLHFEPSICRNITLDIRYLLFIVDRYAGAKHLIDEMVVHQK